ncbi:hypothetical protein ACFLZV_03460 [Candidatus Margulisiibacteriota bacterium]
MLKIISHFCEFKPDTSLWEYYEPQKYCVNQNNDCLTASYAVILSLLTSKTISEKDISNNQDVYNTIIKQQNDLGYIKDYNRSKKQEYDLLKKELKALIPQSILKKDGIEGKFISKIETGNTFSKENKAIASSFKKLLANKKTLSLRKALILAYYFHRFMMSYNNRDFSFICILKEKKSKIDRKRPKHAILIAKQKNSFLFFDRKENKIREFDILDDLSGWFLWVNYCYRIISRDNNFNLIKIFSFKKTIN